MVLLTTALIAPAGASAAGGISGTVTASGGGTALGGICVSASGLSWGSAQTDAAGHYEIQGLAPGGYRVQFHDCSATPQYVDEYFDDAADWSSADPVNVTEGQTTPSIDAQLAIGGTISGLVTGSGGAALKNVCVSASTMSGGSSGSARTGSDGTYAVRALAPGTWTVRFQDCSAAPQFATEWWHGRLTQQTADPVTVTAEHATTGVDAQLALAARITGRVLTADGGALTQACVSATGPGGYTSGYPDAQGNYAIEGLAAGDYKVRFSDCSPTRQYLDEWYDDKADEATATSVPAVSGETTADINAKLQRGAAITGVVTGPDGRPLAGACVNAMTDPPATGYGWAQTDGEGRYTMGALAAGDYRVSFGGCAGGEPYLREWWQDRADQQSADKVHLDPGATAGEIDAQLAAAGLISGHVTKSGGGALASVCVSAQAVAPATGYGYATTDVQGAYVIGGLRAGTYRLEFRDCSMSPEYASEWYDDKASQTDGTGVAVTAGATTPAIDAVLSKGGVISGRVTAPGGAPLQACVSATSTTDGGPSGYAATDAAGAYHLGGLPAGSYRVQFRDCASPINWLSEWYPDRHRMADAQPVSVTAGQTTGGIDAQLEAAGRIAGRVTAEAGEPLADMCISASSGTDAYGSAISDAAGNFVIAGLAPGTYRVQFSDCSRRVYLAEYYDDQASSDDATGVPVDGGGTTSGIDAHLTRGATISGRVTGEGAGPLDKVCVWATRVGDLSAAAFATTDAQGDYVVRPLRAGGYRLQFSLCDGGSDYAPEWYENQVDQAHATPVSVTTGQDRTGLDVVLEIGGTVSGTVLGPDGRPLKDACVIERLPGGADDVSITWSGADGAYRSGALRAGTYRVLFAACGEDREVAPQWYHGHALQSAGDPVTVVAGQDTPAIDATLTPGASIAGRVTSAAGAPLESVCVQATSTDAFVFDGVAYTDEHGDYRISGLQSGTYHVRAGACDGPPRPDAEWFDDADAETAAAAVTLTSGQARTGVDIAFGHRTPESPPAVAGGSGAPAGQTAGGAVAGTTSPRKLVSVAAVRRGSGGVLLVSITCAARAKRACAGMVTLRSANILVGRASFRGARPGRRVVVRVKPTKRGRALLRRAARVRLSVSVTSRDGSGAGAPVTRTLTLPARR